MHHPLGYALPSVVKRDVVRLSVNVLARAPSEDDVASLAESMATGRVTIRPV
jgi:hypothetical protein